MMKSKSAGPIALVSRLTLVVSSPSSRTSVLVNVGEGGRECISGQKMYKRRFKDQRREYHKNAYYLVWR